MLLLAFASLVAVGFAEPPIWYTGGQCGVSQYSDAGDMELPPGKIVGGQEARPYEFPWQVSLRGKPSNSHFCGGSIINERWIVSAAHCLVGETPGGISVVVGEHAISDTTSTVRQTLDVEGIWVHENYNSGTVENDISLAKTSVPIALNVNVQPICAPDPANDYVHYKSQCSGWGTLISGGACCPDVLQYVTMNITTNAYCDEVYTSSTIYDDMICATDNTGMNERDSCQGDSGGPLSVKDGSGIFSLVGIVSWGIGCASGYPGVYARVGTQAAWVTNIINNN
jgi:trypsin